MNVFSGSVLGPRQLCFRLQPVLHITSRNTAGLANVFLHQMALAEWTLLVTNLRLEQLALHEAFILYRVRWQIELLFRELKTHYRIEDMPSSKVSSLRSCCTRRS